MAMYEHSRGTFGATSESGVGRSLRIIRISVVRLSAWNGVRPDRAS